MSYPKGIARKFKIHFKAYIQQSERLVIKIKTTISNQSQHNNIPQELPQWWFHPHNLTAINAYDKFVSLKTRFN